MYQKPERIKRTRWGELKRYWRFCMLNKKIFIKQEREYYNELDKHEKRVFKGAIFGLVIAYIVLIAFFFLAVFKLFSFIGFPWPALGSAVALIFGIVLFYLTFGRYEKKHWRTDQRMATKSMEGG